MQIPGTAYLHSNIKYLNEQLSESYFGVLVDFLLLGWTENQDYQIYECITFLVDYTSLFPSKNVLIARKVTFLLYIFEGVLYTQVKD